MMDRNLGEQFRHFVRKHYSFNRCKSGVILIRLILGLMISSLFGGVAQAQPQEFPMRIDGDIGLGIYYLHSVIKGKTGEASVLPYGSFDLGRMFMRVDTVGIKTMKLGYGYLEIAGRISQDGFNANSGNLRGLSNRQNSVPLGLGTLQITPMGAFFINAFHDINKSDGDLFEAIYVTELDTPRTTFYPLVGAEYLSRNYVRYYYGVSTTEAAASQYSAYQPSGGAFNPNLGLIIDTKLTEEYHVNFFLRRKWLGHAIDSSGIVGKAFMDTGYITVSYRFE